MADDCGVTSDVFCSGVEFANGYSLVHDADEVICNDGECTKNLCCKKTGAHDKPESIGVCIVYILHIYKYNGVLPRVLSHFLGS